MTLHAHYSSVRHLRVMRFCGQHPALGLQDVAEPGGGRAIRGRGESLLGKDNRGAQGVARRRPD